MAALPLVFAGISAVGSIMGAVSQKRATDYNASVADRNAAIALRQGQADEARQRRETMMKLGAQRAGYGASGVTVEGSPLEILEMSAANGELDAQTIRYKSQLRSIGFQETASLERQKGSSAMTAGFIKAGTSLLGAASSGEPAKTYTGDYSRNYPDF